MSVDDPQKEPDDVYFEENSSTVQANTESANMKVLKCKSDKAKLSACLEIMNVGNRETIVNEEFESNDFADGKQLLCQLCAKQYRDRRGFRKHLRACSGNWNIDDGVVSQYSDKSYNQADEEIYEEINEKQVCNTCGQVFLNRNIFRRHTLSCKSPIVMPCPSCDRVFNNPGQLKAHFVSHVEQTVKKFPCSNCDLEFDQIGLLKAHFLTHLAPILAEHRQQEVKQVVNQLSVELKCDYVHSDGTKCNKLFASKYSLERHMNTHFDRKKEFACEKCPKRYYRKQHLQEHVEIFHALSPPRYPCPNCNKTFTRSRHLTSHRVLCKKH